MIGVVDVEIQAKFPNMPLDPMQAFVNSPSSIRLRNVPKRIGKWAIESVQFVAAYPDGSIKTAQCVLTGGVWVGTIEGTSTSGTSKNGYTIFASGTDENGNAVTGYILGKGDIEILEADGTLTPGKTLAYVHLLSADSEGENDGDLWQVSGTWKIRQDGQDWLIGDDSGMIAELSAQLSAKQDKLSQDQLSAIDCEIDEVKTIVTYTQASGLPQWEGIIVGEIEGISISPYYTRQIPNVQYAETIRLGTGVTSIGIRAFDRCNNLTSITIPNSVTSIGGSAFDGCSGITSITIPNSVTSIGYSAFITCSGLTSMVIPNSVTSIGGGAFYRCSGLTSVTIGSGLTSIGQEAFGDCSGLTSLTFKEKTISQVQGMTNYPWALTTAQQALITVENNATQEWVGSQGYATTTQLSTKQDQLSQDQLSSINAEVDERKTIVTYTQDSGLPQWEGTIVGEIAGSSTSPYYTTHIPNVQYAETIRLGTGVTSIGDYAFRDCSGLTHVTIPDNVTSIGERAFYGCSSLVSLRIPDSVTSIGGYVFAKCSSLTSVTIDNGLTSIGNRMFWLCTSLTNITIPNSVTSIGEHAFHGCSGLTSVTIGNGVTSIEGQAFSNCSSLTSVTIPNSVTSIGQQAFYLCSGLTSVTIGNGVTSIEYQAFQGCRGLTSVTIPDSVTIIKGLAFSDCTSLTSVTIGDSVTSIEGYVFYGCSGLTSVTIGSGLTSIRSGVFSGCSGLTSLTIPNSVTTIESQVFQGCSGLTSLTFKGKTLTEVQGMSNYPWSLSQAQQALITVENNATQEWVGSQGYSTQTWVGSQGYATQTWVGQQGYITSSYPVKNAGGVANATAMTQNAYDALQTKDPTTLYVITEN